MFFIFLVLNTISSLICKNIWENYSMIPDFMGRGLGKKVFLAL